MMTIWSSIQQRLERQLEPGQYKVWIAPLKPGLDGSTLRLTAPGDFVATRVRERFLPLLIAAARELLGPDATVEIAVAAAGLPETAPVLSIPNSRPAQICLPTTQILPTPASRRNWNFSFDSFVVGSSNELAHAAAQEFCRESLSVDTLFLSSRTGLGKTHLMQSVGQTLSCGSRQGLRVEYLSAEDFANRLIAALKAHDMARFKARYRELDVLLLEDVHFLQSKDHMQEELLATIDALKARGSRVIFSSSFAPRELKKFESHLLSRLGSGLVAPIELPDFAMRCRLFSEKARQQHQVLLPDEITQLLAQHIRADIRRIESCLASLTLKARLLNRAISLDMALEVISAYADEEIVMDFDAIVRTVCRAFRLSPEQLHSRSRKHEYVLARNTIFFLARKHTDMSLEDIGSRLNRTHTTVIKGISSLERELALNTPQAGEIRHALGLVEKNGRLSF